MKQLLPCLLAATCVAGDFTELTQKRHSGYAFDQSKAVTKETLISLAEAARFSPSSYNDQPWRMIFCDRTLTPEAYKKAFDSLVEPNQKWAVNAPVLVIVLADQISPYTKETNPLAQYDTGAAAMSLVYQATASGLMAHEMGGFDPKKVSDSFQIPAQCKPMAIIAVGYEKTEDKPNEKKRNPLSSSFFLGEWAKGIQ